MPRFLILSMGRTATKWLAETLRVDHEPSGDDWYSAVSPKHLFMMTGGWAIPEGVMPIVMVRDAKAQMLSVMNRSVALGPSKLTMFRGKMHRYLEILNNLVRAGAPTISLEALLEMSEEDLARWAWDDLRLDSITRGVPARNQHPEFIKELPPWALELAEKMQRYYDAWLDGHALEIDPDEPDPTRHEIRFGGRRYRMDYVFPAEIAALRAHRFGRFQEEPVLQWVQNLHMKGVYVDCGAHIGNHSLFFAEHCQSTCVIAIEAHPKIYKLMVGNLKRNCTREREPGRPIWISFQNAAWSKSHETVHMERIPHNNAGHTCIREGGVTPVKTMALDDLLVYENVVVLKIDVEDVEEQVIMGATKMLEEHHPVIIAERHSPAQLRGFEILLKPFGYRRVKEWAGIHTYAWTSVQGTKDE